MGVYPCTVTILRMELESQLTQIQERLVGLFAIMENSSRPG